MDEVEILLLAHELRLNKFKKSSTPDLISLNLAQAQAGSSPANDTQATVVDSTPSQTPPSPAEQDFSQFRGSRGSRGCHFGRGRGRT